MSANVRLIYPNYVDDATLSTSPALVSTLPVDNLKDPSRGLVARTTGLDNPLYVRGNLASLLYCTGMALVRHNLTSAATIRLLLYDNLNQTGTVTYDSGTVSLGAPLGWGDFAWGIGAWGGDAFTGWATRFSALWFTAALTQSFELRITDLANTDGYYEASRLFLGAYFEPTANFDWDVEQRWVDPSTQERTAGGTLRTDAEESYRRWEIGLSWLTQSDRARLANILRDAGKRDDVFFSAFPDETGERLRDYSGQAKFVEPPGLLHNLPGNYKTADKIILEEV